MEDDLLGKMIKAAATSDFLKSNPSCELCGGTSFTCTNRVLLGTDMCEDYKCNDCDNYTFHIIENY